MKVQNPKKAARGEGEGGGGEGRGGKLGGVANSRTRSIRARICSKMQRMRIFTDAFVA